MPDTPSKEELAIQAALETLTAKMDEQHKESMAEFSRLGRNQFFLHSTDKLQMLNQLTRA